ncbi:MAG: helix-turn-helix domain-containing protein [Muribaculaceae bacterium]|nr:helix-turn-helix domain-containing protein [Muribaculaceae bacterium]
MIDYSEYSAPELVCLLGKKFKEFRILAKKTQKEVAEMTGLTIPTIQRFENGQSKNINLSTFLLLMKAVGSLNMLDALLTDEPESLYLYSDKRKKIQRIRHKKQ